jgi:hypothetical protein
MILKMEKDILTSISTTTLIEVYGGCMDTINIACKCSSEGWIKLNCDMTYKKVQDVAGCGG